MQSSVSADAVAGGCSGYPEGCVHSVHAQENRKRKFIVHVVTGFGVRVSWPDRSTHCACTRKQKRKSIVHVVT